MWLTRVQPQLMKNAIQNCPFIDHCTGQIYNINRLLLVDFLGLMPTAQLDWNGRKLQELVNF